MMTMMMMQRIIESSHKGQELSQSSVAASVPASPSVEKDFEHRRTPLEDSLFLQPKRMEDPRDVEMCEKHLSESEDDEDLNVDGDVDVENDDTLPVDLTRRQENFYVGGMLAKTVSDDVIEGVSDKPTVLVSTKPRPESECSDVSRSDSPRDVSPSVVANPTNRRLAFSVENILDPNKFTGKQAVFTDVCCWKPHQESMGSSEFDGSETGKFHSTLASIMTKVCKSFDPSPLHVTVYNIAKSSYCKGFPAAGCAKL